MERLTKIGHKGYAMLKGSVCNYSHVSFGCQVDEGRELLKYALEKLADYEDLEEQGLLLRLPCKVGDTIYEVSYENGEFVIKEHVVEEFIYRTHCFPRIEIYCENENDSLMCNNIGKFSEFLFLTKAEAEQKLKEIKDK